MRLPSTPRPMPELLDRIRTEMSTRLAELRPLVDEHTRLNAALQALGDVDSRKSVRAPAVPAASRSRAPKTTPANARKRAPRGANRLAVLRAVEDRPGASSAEWPRPPAFSPTPCTRSSRALSRAASCRKRRCRPDEPDTYSLARSRKRQQAEHLPPPTRCRSRMTVRAGRACRSTSPGESANLRTLRLTGVDYRAHRLTTPPRRIRVHDATADFPAWTGCGSPTASAAQSS